MRIACRARQAAGRFVTPVGFHGNPGHAGLRYLLLLIGMAGVSLPSGSEAVAQGGRTAVAEPWGEVTRRVSVDSTGAVADGMSRMDSPQTLSADGRFVTFSSIAANLVPGDTNGSEDVFVHDRLTGETVRASVDSQGRQADSYSSTPSISADGRWVAFTSVAANLVSEDFNDAHDIFVHDLVTCLTVRVSVDSRGGEADQASVRPTISADGRMVAFSSYATNLVPGDTNGVLDTFVHDRLTGETIRVSVSSSGQQGNGESSMIWASISADGRCVTFPSLASNLVPGDSNGVTDIFVHDLLTHQTSRVSVDSAGAEADRSSWQATISADGRCVAFASLASNLVSGDTNDRRDVFVHDRLTGCTTRVSLSWSGSQGAHGADEPSISADGRHVAFRGVDLGRQSEVGSDIFVYDRLTGETVLASPSDAGNHVYSSQWCPSIAPDGRSVAFESVGVGLVPDDAYQDYEVYVRGPWLTLDVDPLRVGPAQTLVLTLYEGGPLDPASIWVVAVNGVPSLWPVAIGTFMKDGHQVVSAQVPPGLSGQTLTVRGYGFVTTHHGRTRIIRSPLARSNAVTVSFL